MHWLEAISITTLYQEEETDLDKYTLTSAIVDSDVFPTHIMYLIWQTCDYNLACHITRGIDYHYKRFKSYN